MCAAQWITGSAKSKHSTQQVCAQYTYIPYKIHTNLLGMIQSTTQSTEALTMYSKHTSHF